MKTYEWFNMGLFGTTCLIAGGTIGAFVFVPNDQYNWLRLGNTIFASAMTAAFFYLPKWLKKVKRVDNHA